MVPARRVRLKRPVHIEKPEAVGPVEDEADRAAGRGGFGVAVLVGWVDRFAIAPGLDVGWPFDGLAGTILVGFKGVGDEAPVCPQRGKCGGKGHRPARRDWNQQQNSLLLTGVHR